MRYAYDVLVRRRRAARERPDSRAVRERPRKTTRAASVRHTCVRADAWCFSCCAGVYSVSRDSCCLLCGPFHVSSLGELCASMLKRISS